MVFAKNRVAVTPNYSEVATYRLERENRVAKLSIFVRDSPVILQVTEGVEQYFDLASETEILLEEGFHSRSFVTPISAWRFKAETVATTVDFVAYGT